MMKISKVQQWLIAGAIIAAIVIVSGVLTLFLHKGQGTIKTQMITDGSGGAFIAWQVKDGIYLQRIDASGALMWRKGGIRAGEGHCPDPYNNNYFGYSLVADGTGGAFLTWVENYTKPEDYEDPEIYEPIVVFTQRVSPSGELLWGKGVVTGKVGRTVYGGLPRVIPDGSGGCLYAWDDFEPVYRALHDDYLRVQKLDAAGNALWGDNGVLIASSALYHTLTDEEIAQGFKGTYMRYKLTFEGRFMFMGDGSGGAFVFWQVVGEEMENIIYVQRIDPDGGLAWSEGRLIAFGYLHQAFSDGRGGVTFLYSRQDNNMLVQSMGADGALRWGDSGLTGEAYIYRIESDGPGGTVLMMQENEVTPDKQKIGSIVRTTWYLRRVDNQGNMVWGQAVDCSAGLNPVNLALAIAPDGSGGQYAVFREGAVNSSIGGRLNCRRIDADGTLSWAETGLDVFNNTSLRYISPALAVGDGAGGVIISAAVGKNPFRGDMVYVQRIDANGARLWGEGVRIDR